jgi:hypothetical protein
MSEHVLPPHSGAFVDGCPACEQDIRTHRARRRQRTLDKLREAAKTSDSARKLLDQVDPDGGLRFTDDDGRPVKR